ncbi:MAG TPA: ABC transporter substrate-binding protein [Hyphomicrobiaceae bacterium]|jgi:phospholipid transport system substrate-binding protein
MSTDVSRGEAGCVRRVGLGPRLGALLAMLFALAVPAAADPAVQFVQRMANELHVAARAKSPQLISNVIQRYGDVNYIGSYSLGTYRAQLAANDRQLYHSGIVKFLGRYAANEAPKYPVAKYEIISPSVQGANGTMVDSRITLKDGNTYDVRWLLSKYGNTYRVRDAMVYGFWMTPFLKKLFEDYVGENGGNVKALVVVLNR